jgi:PAS domain S-box-containing protein
MNKNSMAPTIAELRRRQRIFKRQIQNYTAELELANKSLNAEVAQRECVEEGLNLLLRIAQEMASAHDFPSAVDIALRRICEYTGWACGEAWVPSSDGTVLEFNQGCCGDSNGFEQFKRLSQNFRFPPGVGVPGLVWVSKQPEWVHDISAALRAKYPRCDLAKQFGLKSALGTPVFANGKVVAVLVFFMVEAGEADKRLAELVSTAAAQLGITLQHKRAEQALQEREALLQAIIDQSKNIIWVKDGEGHYQFINREFEQLFRISREDVKGRTDYDIFPGRIADAFRANDLKVAQTGATMEFEEIAPLEDGEHTYISNKFPLCQANGKAPTVCGIATDITERKRAEEFLELRIQRRTKQLLRVNGALQVEIAERRQIEEALQGSREQLRTLATRLQAAHESEKIHLAREIHDELSGTLTALKLDLALLPNRAAKDRGLFLEKLNSMAGLIDGTLARIRTVATELRPIVLDKFGLVAAIEWQIGEFEDRSGIRCETRLPTEVIPLDPEPSTAVFRILQEALTNVARHAHANKVVVDLGSEAGSLILTVSDNGKGIDEQMIHAAHSIGLLGMRERARSFGGTAEVTRSPGGGTLVSVRIPLHNNAGLSQ